MSVTHPGDSAESDHDHDDDSGDSSIKNIEDVAEQSRVSAHNDYIKDSDGGKSSEGSDDITPQNLDDEGGFAGGHFMGEAEYAVDEFTVQQHIMHSHRQDNHLNVKMCLLLEVGLSVLDKRTTVANFQMT